jgi:hypothetical protein
MNQATCFKDDHTIAQAPCLLAIMRHHYAGQGSFGHQSANQLLDAGLGAVVQRRRRLIE